MHGYLGMCSIDASDWYKEIILAIYISDWAL